MASRFWLPYHVKLVLIWFYITYFSLLVVSQVCELQFCNNQVCCGNATTCPEPVTTTDCESRGHYGNIVITSIHIVNTSQLGVTWNVTTDASAVEAFTISTEIPTDSVTYCQIFNNITQLPTHSAFSHSCIILTQSQLKVIVTVSSLPKKQHDSFHVYLPQDSTQVPVLAIQVIENTINGLVTPPTSNVVVLLRRDDGNAGIWNTTLSGNRFRFILVQFGSYNITVLNGNPECTPEEPKCILSKSDTFKVEQVPVTSTETSPTTIQNETGRVTTIPTTRSTMVEPTTRAPMPPTEKPKVSSTTEHNDVIVRPAPADEYKKNLIIILAVVFSMMGVATLVIIGVCLYRRKRRSNPGNIQMQRLFADGDSNNTFTMEYAVKVPSVLVLYSTDCEAHIKVVVAFATYLRDVWKCDVQLDLWDSDKIQERGLHNWVTERIDEATHVVFVCSTGARFQCSKGRKARLKEIRVLPDSFVTAVDIAGEKMRLSKTSGDCLSKFVSLYFNYSNENDVPTKLDLTLKYSMMSDVYDLYQHVYELKTQTGKISSKLNGMTPEKYKDTDKGKLLYKALKEAKKYFQENPQWLVSRLEQGDKDTASEESQSKNGKKSPRKSNSPNNVKNGPSNEREPLPPATVKMEDESDTIRRQRREVYLQNGTNPRNASFIKSKSKHIPSNHSSASSTTALLPVQGTGTSPNNINLPPKETVTEPNNKENVESPSSPTETIKTSKSNNSLEELEEVSFSPEEELNQMQKDIEFINSAGTGNSHLLTDSAVTTHWLLDGKKGEFQAKLSYMNPLYETLHEGNKNGDIMALINQAEPVQENGQVVSIRC